MGGSGAIEPGCPDDGTGATQSTFDRFARELPSRTPDFMLGAKVRYNSVVDDLASQRWENKS